MTKIHRPDAGDAPPWCLYFFNLSGEQELIGGLKNNKLNTLDLIGLIPPSLENYSYLPGKWTIKEIFIHLLDTERFYAYRALCSSRQVDVDLEFNPSAFALFCHAEKRSLKDIAEEFSNLRESTISLFSCLTNQMLDYKGFPGKPIYTSRSLGWMTLGHNLHHCNAIKELYLKPIQAF